MSAARVVVIGASIGGVRTVQALRTAGYAGEIVLVDADPELPYDRPPLSKAELRGAEEAHLMTAGQAQALGVTLLLGTGAERLDPGSGQVVLTDGRSLGYDDLVLASGAHARVSPWGMPRGVHLLRTRAHARALRADLRRCDHLVVIGAGFIGAEVAATARSLDVPVTLVDPLEAPLSRVLGAEVGRHVTRLHRRHGVRTRLGVGVEGITAGDPLVIRLTDGAQLRAGTVVVGIGAQPCTEWLETSGLVIDDGVLCDQYSRAVGAHGVHAVGDVARWWHPRYGEYVRVEHWTNAVEQAAAVAHNIVHPGEPRPYQPVEYVWSDQYDWRIQMAGRTLGAEARLLGDPETGRFAAIYSGSEERLMGVMTVNWPRAALLGRQALAAAQPASDLLGRLDALGARPA